MPDARRAAVILAAGKGTRMRSHQPKVLHAAAGRPLLAWVVEAARAAGCDPVVVVVGHGGDEVRAAMTAGDSGADLTFVEQEQQLGTGHALLQASGAVPAGATVLVLSGDVPLVSAATLSALAASVEGGDAPAWGAVAVAEVDEPGALGRVIARPEEGGQPALERIVEAADASAEELAVRRVNAGLYAFPAPAVFEYLARVEPANAQGEIYLTDAPGAAVADGHRVALYSLPDPAEARGVNDRAQLAEVHRLLIARHLDRLAAAGVTVLDPARTVVEPGVEVGADTVLHPGVSLLGTTRVGAGCTLHQGVWLRDTRLGDGVTVEPYSVLDQAEVAGGCRVGPFARLRPGAHLAEGARVGNFVEVKNSHLGAGAKANHLAYVGDAEVGAHANLGAGVVTCNYDGVNKHRTVVGEGAFVGSDTMLVAPVSVGAEATTAAGSTITQDVPDGALGVGRARQRTIPGWSERRPRGTTGSKKD